MHRVALVWLRRDLRLLDNEALRYACANAESVALVYIHAPEEESPWTPGAASRWWLHLSLQDFAQQLAKRGQALVLRSGPVNTALRRLIEETGATLVVWNRLYEPQHVQRDAAVKKALRESGVEARSFNAALLFEPWDIRTQQEQPYKVFTPFWRKCAAELDTLPQPEKSPTHLPPLKQPLESLHLDALKLRPQIPWDTGLKKTWRVGETSAHEQLQRFIERNIERYSTARDFPGETGTSRLSPYLHFGEISPRQVLHAVRSDDRSKGYAAREHYVRQLIWREFAHHLLYHFPHTAKAPFDDRFARYRWKKTGSQLQRWQEGKTGFPIVDAGMRELWTTGYMHNRVRMLVASLLTKNLNFHWLAGARWFWDTLVDADLANNTLGWQWTAGCGTDAAPFFRIFNPEVQSQRFDPAGIYLRRWLPELAQLSDKSIHAPHVASATELAAAGVVLGKTYPLPIVDLKASRVAALEAYAELK